MKHRRFPLPVVAILTTLSLLMQSTAQSPPTVPPEQPSAPAPIQPQIETPEPLEDQPSPVTQPVVPAIPATPNAAPQRVVVPKKVDQVEKLYSFKFEGADLDTVMQTYCEWTGQIYLKTDAVKAAVTLKADSLTKRECIEVMEAILGMNNIVLVPMGDKYVKVVQATAPDLGGQGLKINMDPEQAYAVTDKIVTQIIQLKNVQIPEVQTAVQHLMHAYGKIQTLERSNSLMITDTESNMLRIRELIEFIDQASARIEPRIYEIKYAEATEIAAKLNEVITMAQGEQKSPTGVVAGNPAARTPPGVMRASASGQPQVAPTQATISATEGSSSVIIQGVVKVMADERTNIILIFSQKENFEFFDKIIEVLDVEVEPAVTFVVVNLEYADAEELSSTLNDLVGAATGNKSSSPSSSSSSSSGGSSSQSRSSGSAGSNQRRSSSSNSNPSQQQVAPKADVAIGATAIENLSRLSENTKILADKRTNSILLMGQKSDIAAIKNVIQTLDVMLEQVLIEAAISEVSLGDDLRHGIDWLYNAQNKEKVAAWNGTSLVNSATNGLGNVAAGALTYYENLTGINTKIAINLAASDSNVRLLATPVIMTTDNTEARLSVGEQRPVVTSTSSYANSSGTQSSNYEYKDIGIQLTVTPRINPARFVIMEILQKADQVGEQVSIDGNQVPIILNREFEASIAVPDRGTIALGGLINSEKRDTVTKIPILGDIPLIGRYLFSSVVKSTRQTELIVLMTPYVLTDQMEMIKETERLYDSIDMQPTDWPSKGWSDTTLSTRPKPDDEDEMEPNKK